MKPKDQNKIRQIYEATIKIAGQKGLFNLCMAEVAKEAGLATGTLYTYFKSKDDLLENLFNETLNEYKNALYFNCSTDEPVKILLFKIWENYLNYNLKKFEEVNYREQCSFSALICKNNIEKQKESLFDTFIQILERGKQEEIIKHIENKLIIALFIGFIKELAKTTKLGIICIDEQTAKNTFGLFWNAIKK